MCFPGIISYKKYEGWIFSEDDSITEEAEDEHEKSFNDLPLSDVCDFSGWLNFRKTLIRMAEYRRIRIEKLLVENGTTLGEGNFIMPQ